MGSDKETIYKVMLWLRDTYFNRAHHNPNETVDWHWLIAADKCLDELKKELNLGGKNGLRDHEARTADLKDSTGV